MPIEVRFTEVDGSIARDLLMFAYGTTLDRAIASELVLKDIQEGSLAPTTQVIKDVMGVENTSYFSKNTDIVFDNIDARDAFGKLIGKSGLKDANQARVAAIELIKTMENINDINAVKANLLKAYPV